MQLHVEQTTKHIQSILTMEAASPFTQNLDDLEEKRSKFLARYRQERGMPSAARDTQTVEQVLTSLVTLCLTEENLSMIKRKLSSFIPHYLCNEEGLKKLIQALLAALALCVDGEKFTKIKQFLSSIVLLDLNQEASPPDTYKDELEMMAEVQAYFQISYQVRGVRRLDRS